MISILNFIKQVAPLVIAIIDRNYKAQERSLLLLSLLSFLALLLCTWSVAVLIPYIHDVLIVLLLCSLQRWGQDGTDI